MWTSWDIVERNDGAFDIFRNGKEEHRCIPARWLQWQLEPHGIFRSDYEDILQQLFATGKAHIEIPPLGKFSM